MRDQLIALQRLQEIDVKIARAQARLAALDGAKELKRRYISVRRRLEEAEKTLQAQETELMDIELKLKSVDEKRVRFENRLYGGGITNSKEAAAVEKEIEMLKQQQSCLDTAALGLYDSVEVARKAVREARSIFSETENQLRRALGQESAERKKLEAELDGLTRERDASASAFADRSLLARYDNIRRKTGNTAIARVVDNRCEGCRVAVTPGVLRQLAASSEIVSCESCGRLLLLNPESDE